MERRIVDHINTAKYCFASLIVLASASVHQFGLARFLLGSSHYETDPSTTNHRLGSARVLRGMAVLLFAAFVLAGCGYSKEQVEETRNRAYHEGARDEREKWEAIVRRLQAENQSLKNENKALKSQLEQTAAELETQRLKTRHYQILFYTLLGFFGLSALGVGVSSGYYFIRTRRDRSTPRETYNWTSPPPSVTQAD